MSRTATGRKRVAVASAALATRSATGLRYVSPGRTNGFTYAVHLHGRWIGDVRKRDSQWQAVSVLGEQVTCIPVLFGSRRTAAARLKRMAEER